MTDCCSFACEAPPESWMFRLVTAATAHDATALRRLLPAAKGVVVDVDEHPPKSIDRQRVSELLSLLPSWSGNWGSLPNCGASDPGGRVECTMVREDKAYTVTWPSVSKAMTIDRVQIHTMY